MMMKLCDAKNEKQARIVSIEDGGEHLLELGFTENGIVVPLFYAPHFKNKRRAMRAYLVRSSVIAIRQEDAERIVVEEI